jgi:hypothetical protein
MAEIRIRVNKREIRLLEATRKEAHLEELEEVIRLAVWRLAQWYGVPVRVGDFPIVAPRRPGAPLDKPGRVARAAPAAPKRTASSANSGETFSLDTTTAEGTPPPKERP